MTDILQGNCPFCGVSFQGDPIPEGLRAEYYGGSTHYSRLIAIYDRDRDRTVAWRCPDCHKEWDR
jgi:hypothetical protein